MVKPYDRLFAYKSDSAESIVSISLLTRLNLALQFSQALATPI